MSTEGKLLSEELHKLNPSALVELFELDARPAGDDSVLYFHNGTLGINIAISFMGIAYNPLPIEVKGFEVSQAGEQPRPKMEIANVGGFVSALVLKTQDLVGAKLTRILTYARFLDHQPTAASVIASRDIFYVERKSRESKRTVEFELATSLDLDGVMYPTRKIVSGYCSAEYRGMNCEFPRTMVVADDKHVLFKGAAKFTGNWSETRTYNKDESVMATDDSGFTCVYVCLSTTPVTGFADGPTNATVWQKVQRYRGVYNAEVTDYVLNDVVSRTVNGVTVFAISIWNGVIPAGKQPPNSFYWKTDQCAKYLLACQDRFDPMRQNLPLPYNGFPGTINMPEL